jgi:hypothetical protein
MPLEWPAALFPEGAVIGFLAALAGATLGAWIGAHLTVEPGLRRPLLRQLALGSAALIAAMVALALYTPTQRGASADVVLRPLGPGEVEATLTLHPPDAAEQADWFDVTAWQGGGLVVAPLREIGPGRYRTNEPIPVDGNWKSMVRLHEGRSLTAMPIFLPSDPAIPVGEVPAPPRFTRAFGDEHQLLQREQKGGSPVVVTLAYATVAAITLGLLALIAWALHRLAFGPARERRRPTPRTVASQGSAP